MVKVIAEIGINHNGDLHTALDLVYKSHEAGVDAVKFQKRDLNHCYSPRVLENPNGSEWNFDYLIPLLQELELSKSDFWKIKDLCDSLNLELIITPMDAASASFVNELNIKCIKIASGDMTNFPLIEQCSSYSTELLISTGMWGIKDIKKCADFYNSKKINFSLLLANSTYPTPYESISLGFLKNLKMLSNKVGYSGHERGIFIPVAAVALGAEIIEKHITLDRSQPGPDHKASLLPEEFAQMVKDIRSLELSLGEEKIVNQQETLSKELFSKSAVPLRDLSINHELTANDIEFKSPGKGLFPHEVHEFYGLKLKKFIPKGKYISKEDFGKPDPISSWEKFNFTKRWGVKCRFHDYEKYKLLNCPIIEFHCSQNDLTQTFNEGNSTSELIVHAPEIVDRELVNICSHDEKVVARSLSILQQSIDKTLSISQNWPKAKPKMVVHLGGMSLDLLPATTHGIDRISHHDEMISLAIHNFKKLNFCSDEIDIIPENLPPRPWYLGGQWYQYGFAPYSDMVRFCEETKTKMTYDICHAQLQCNLEKISLAEYTSAVKNYVGHVHISDASGLSAEGIQVMEGDIDFQSTFDILKDIDFSWVTEIWSGHLHEGSGTKKALEILEKKVNYL